jgi:hypothetical protein
MYVGKAELACQGTHAIMGMVPLLIGLAQIFRVIFFAEVLFEQCIGHPIHDFNRENCTRQIYQLRHPFGPSRDIDALANIRINHWPPPFIRRLSHDAANRTRFYADTKPGLWEVSVTVSGREDLASPP